MPIPLALTIGAGVAGVANQLFSKPKPNDYDFSFNRQDVNYSQNPDLLASMASLNQTANTLGGAGNQFMNQYNELTDPNSAYAKSQQADMATRVGDSAQQNRRMQEQAIASQNGPASLGNLLRAVGGNRANETISRGMRDIGRQNLQMAGQFGGLATQAYGAQAGAQGQAGQFANAMDARQLQTNMENTRSQNQYNQYLKTSGYNQMVDNQSAQANWRSGMTNSLMGIAGFGAGDMGTGFKGGNSTWFGSGIDGLLGIGGGG